MLAYIASRAADLPSRPWDPKLRKRAGRDRFLVASKSADQFGGGLGTMSTYGSCMPHMSYEQCIGATNDLMCWWYMIYGTWLAALASTAANTMVMWTDGVRIFNMVMGLQPHVLRSVAVCDVLFLDRRVSRMAAVWDVPSNPRSGSLQVRRCYRWWLLHMRTHA